MNLFDMFNLECILYFIIIVYSLFCQLYAIVIYKRNKKVFIKDGSGLFIAKDVLNKNGLGTLYVTKIDGKYNDHYDIERNVIRLSDEVYNDSDLASVSVALYQAIKAITADKSRAKEEKLKTLIFDWLNKIAFVLFIIGASSKAIDLMTLSLGIMILIILVRYDIIVKRERVVSENINYLRKAYELKKGEVKTLERSIRFLLYNELSLHVFNNRY